MSKKMKFSNEPVATEVIDDDFPLPPEELAAIDRAWLDEVQIVGIMKQIHELMHRS